MVSEDLYRCATLISDGRTANGFRAYSVTTAFAFRSDSAERLAKKDLPKPAATERRIQFDDRSVNQKQNKDPNLNSGKAVPGEVCRHILGNST